MTTETRIIETQRYLDECAEIGLTAAMRQEIRDKIRENPTKGTPIGAGAFKFYHAFRGGGRVIHFHIETQMEARNYVLTIYLKSQKADLTPEEYELLRRRAREMKDRLK